MTHRFTLEVLLRIKAIRVPPLKTWLKEANDESKRLAEHYLSAGVFALHLNSDIGSLMPRKIGSCESMLRFTNRLLKLMH